MPQVEEARPPYVTFETRAIEDREASQLAGHYMAKDITFACVTPQGSKDIFEMEVNQWFTQLKADTEEDRFPPDWLRAFRHKYEVWLETKQIPLDGTPIARWPLLSPAQIANILSARVMTVEDLAAANEETMDRIGMGSRDLKRLAQDYLAASKDTGKMTAEMEALRVMNETLTKDNTDLRERVTRMEAMLEELSNTRTSKKL